MFWTAASLLYLPQAQQNSSQDMSTAVAFSARCLLELCGELVKILNSISSCLCKPVCLQKDLERILSQDGHFSLLTPERGRDRDR